MKMQAVNNLTGKTDVTPGKGKKDSHRMVLILSASLSFDF